MNFFENMLKVTNNKNLHLLKVEEIILVARRKIL